MCCAGDCVCSCWLGRRSTVEKRLFSWGDAASGESWLQALASHRGTKGLSGKGQTGHPMPALAHIQLPDQKLCSRMVTWPVWVELPHVLLSTPLFHLFYFLSNPFPSLSLLPLSLCFSRYFSQATPRVCPMGNMVLELVPLWLMIYHRYKKKRDKRPEAVRQWSHKHTHKADTHKSKSLDTKTMS